MRLVTTIFLSFSFWVTAPCQHTHSIKRESIVGKFKYSNLKEFQVDSVFWPEDTVRNAAPPYHRYSSQKNPRGFEEFTVIENFIDEIMCGKRIWYVIFDSKQQLLGQFIVSDDSRDCSSNEPGYYSKAYGKFIDDRTYELYSQWIEKGTTRTLTTYTVTSVKISQDGKLIVKESSSKTVSN